MASNIEEFLAQDERKDLLRLLTAGSVDDGKSTLIGACCSTASAYTRTSCRRSNATANAAAMRATISTTRCCATA